MELPKINTTSRFSTEAPNQRAYSLTEECKTKSNAHFFATVRERLDVLGRKDKRFQHGGRVAIGLMGEYSLIAMAIRDAERLLRWNRQPSHWSHSFLIADKLSVDPRVNGDPKNSPWIWESTLEPADPFGDQLDRNGVAPRRLADYDFSGFELFRAHCVPNVAVVAFGLTNVEAEAIRARANDPSVDRLAYDLTGLLGTWYAYITNQADKPNPLSTGDAIFCSAYVQLAYEAAGIDLARGAHQKNTSPEHIWQTARWFSESYEEESHPVAVFYCIRDPYGGLPPIATPEPRKLEDVVKAAFAVSGGKAKRKRR